MIIRKPFKFLIQHFKVINLIILLLVGFVTYKIGKIYFFLDAFIKANYSTNEMNLVSRYIGFLLPLSIIVILCISIVIFILFKSKDKDNKAFLFIIVFYIAEFIFTLYTKKVLDVYEFDIVETSLALMIRDISRFALYPNIAVIIIILLNVIGFDFSSFSFTNLQDEIDIAEEDDQEIEVGVQLEDYKLKRRFFKTIRELKYYIIENKFVFEVIAGIIGIILLFFVVKFGIYLSKSVTVSQSFNYNTFNISINDSVLSELDYAGNKIKQDYTYLAILVNVTNKSKTAEKLSTDNFWLEIDGKVLYPILDKSSYFVDIGEPYFGDKIKPGDSHRYVLVYELNKEQVKSSFRIKILNSISYKDGIADPKYNYIKLSPKKYNGINDRGTYKLGDMILLKDTKLLSSVVKVFDYMITPIYNYRYDYCYQQDCREYTGVISNSNNLKKTYLVLDDNIQLDTNSSYITFKKSSNFYQDFVKIRYEFAGKKYYSTVVDKSSDKDKANKTVLEVDYNVSKAEKVDMVITIRNQQYVINLFSNE